MPVATGLGVVRRALRLRNVAAALVGVGLSLTLVSVSAQPAGALPVVPVPVTGPSSLLGTVTEAGTAGAEISGAGIVAAALAGQGAYQGTCWVLGKLYHGGSCDAGSASATVLHWAFGANGDDRSTTNWWTPTSGPGRSLRGGGTCAYGLGGVCAPDGFTQAQFETQAFSPILSSWPSGYGEPFREGVTCQSGTSYEFAWAIPTEANWSTNAIDMGAMTDAWEGTVCGTAGFATVNGKSVLASVKAVWIDKGTCTGTNAPYCQNSSGNAATPSISEATVNWSRQTTWSYDPVQPWTATWTQTCTDGTTTSTQTATATWTPTANGAAPTPDLAACPAGQHVSDQTVTGGRGGATELTIDQPTWSSSATTSYPLCTTHAPPGGCFLDLQKNGQSCFSGGVYCAGWMNNETRWVMKCEWGPYELATSICEAEYGTTFDFETPSEPSQGPTTGAGGFPNPSQSPTTGTTTGALPTTGANPSGVPTPYDPTQPGPGGLPAPSPEGANCWGSGWSWDPVSWVYVPVKCSLSWAFVPTTWPTWPSFPWAAPGVPHFTDDCPNLTLNLGHGAGVHNLDICGQITAFEARPLWGSVTPPDLMGGLVTFFFAVRLLEKFEGAIGKGSEE